jgi:hypothetical protein
MRIVIDYGADACLPSSNSLVPGTNIALPVNRLDTESWERNRSELEKEFSHKEERGSRRSECR